jgi:peptidoglycan/LPS O-acetylase OafA/YrhL
MFFSLSGFLIIRLLYLEKLNFKTINLKKFFMRRVLRILPLYYFVLFFGLFYYRSVLPFFGFEFSSNYNLFSGLILSLTLFANVFATYSPGGIIEVLWSISIEEQFYLIIAPLMLIIPTRKIIYFLVFITLFYIIIYFSNCFIFLKEFNMYFFYFLFSGILSILSLNFIFNSFINKILKYLCFILFIIYFSTSIFKNSMNEMIYNIFSMFIFAFTLFFLIQKKIVLFEKKIIIYLGKISYGIYMFHAIIMQFIGFLFLKFNFLKKIDYSFSVLLFNILVIVLTICIAHFSYKYYENYFIKLKIKYKK